MGSLIRERWHTQAVSAGQLGDKMGDKMRQDEGGQATGKMRDKMRHDGGQDDTRRRRTGTIWWKRD